MSTTKPTTKEATNRLIKIGGDLYDLAEIEDWEPEEYGNYGTATDLELEDVDVIAGGKHSKVAFDGDVSLGEPWAEVFFDTEQITVAWEASSSDGLDTSGGLVLSADAARELADALRDAADASEAWNAPVGDAND